MLTCASQSRQQSDPKLGQNIPRVECPTINPITAPYIRLHVPAHVQMHGGARSLVLKSCATLITTAPTDYINAYVPHLPAFHLLLELSNMLLQLSYLVALCLTLTLADESEDDTNKMIAPVGGETIQPEQPYEIKWNPTTPGFVSLSLRTGIVSDISISCTQWFPPLSTPNNMHHGSEIVLC
jgi:hypothetical protein